MLSENMHSGETDRRTEKILRYRREMNMIGGCDRCPPHRKENARRVARRSWKQRYRSARQYTHSGAERICSGRSSWRKLLNDTFGALR